LGIVQCGKYGVELKKGRVFLAKTIGDDVGWSMMNCTAISMEVYERVRGGWTAKWSFATQAKIGDTISRESRTDSEVVQVCPPCTRER
jgi:hypothetical protein